MNTQKQRGFTIIEVVLVLAIAGLIFLMVFLALPALQRGQRDTARKNDVNIVVTSLNNYRSNNKGSFTGLTAATLATYIDTLSQYDKTTNITVLNPGTTTVVTTTANQIWVYTGVKCGTVAAATVTPTTTAASSRTAVVFTGLENNGTSVLATCQDI